MKLIDDLRTEHELIEQVIGALRTFVNGLLAGTPDANDGPAFIGSSALRVKGGATGL